MVSCASLNTIRRVGAGLTADLIQRHAYTHSGRTDIASYAGHRLMCRTEYAAGSDSYASILFAKHLPNEDAKQNGILYGEHAAFADSPRRQN